MIEGLDFFTAPLKPNGWVNNAFIGAIPGHPIIDRALNALQPREFHGYDKHGTGPRFLDTLLREYPEATRLPAELFYQTSPGQLADAVATHHAAGSWKDIESYRNAVGLAERRNFELRGQIETLEREVEALRAKVARAEEATAGRRGFLRR